MADQWGSPPGTIGDDARADSPASNMRNMKLENQRRLLKEKNRRKNEQHVGLVKATDGPRSGRGKRGESKPLVSSGPDRSEYSSPYAFDGPQAYDTSYEVSNGDSTTKVQVVNVSANESDSEQMGNLTPPHAQKQREKRREKTPDQPSKPRPDSNHPNRKLSGKEVEKRRQLEQERRSPRREESDEDDDGLQVESMPINPGNDPAEVSYPHLVTNRLKGVV